MVKALQTMLDIEQKGSFCVRISYKERHQISGEILYLYNVKIEGGRGSELLVS